SAEVVAETVAVPIEKQVQGSQKMVSMISKCTGEGQYTLLVTFERGVDLDKAQVEIDKQVKHAAVKLPGTVNRLGVTIKKRPVSPVLLVALVSPDGSRGIHYLGNYAALQIQKELARIAGLGEVTAIGG